MAFVSGGGEFGVEQMKAAGLFPTVLDFNDLQKLVVSKNLQDKVPTISEPIGLTRLAKAYKPFLWANFRRITKDGKPRLQLTATNAENSEELFATAVYLDYG